MFRFLVVLLYNFGFSRCTKKVVFSIPPPHSFLKNGENPGLYLYDNGFLSFPIVVFFCNSVKDKKVQYNRRYTTSLPNTSYWDSDSWKVLNMHALVRLKKYKYTKEYVNFRYFPCSAVK